MSRPRFRRHRRDRPAEGAGGRGPRRDPLRVAQAYTEDTVWRNREEFLQGRGEVVAFQTRTWDREPDYALRKELWAVTDDRIAVRFRYEWHDADGRTWRSYGNETWKFSADGLMRRREASINDVQIEAADRWIRGPREDGDTTPLPLR